MGGGGVGPWIKVIRCKHYAVDDGSHQLAEGDLVSLVEEAPPCGAEVRRVMTVGCGDELEALAPGMKELV